MGFIQTGVTHRKKRLTQTYPIALLQRKPILLIIPRQVHHTRFSNAMPGTCRQKNHNAPLWLRDSPKP